MAIHLINPTKKQNSFVVLDEESLQAELFKAGGVSTQPKSATEQWRIKRREVNLIYYRSGMLLVQGEDRKVELTARWLRENFYVEYVQERLL